jgi:hypothetical protein
MRDFVGVTPNLDYLAVGKPITPDEVEGHVLGLLCRFKDEHALEQYLYDKGHIDMIKTYGGKVYDWGECSSLVTE